jgi:hypothetical protein
MPKRHLLQKIVVVLILSLGSGFSPAEPAPVIVDRPMGEAYADWSFIRPIEVRTRRLHLVRPDLLHYPIQYDTYC